MYTVHLELFEKRARGDDVIGISLMLQRQVATIIMKEKERLHKSLTNYKVRERKGGGTKGVELLRDYLYCKEGVLGHHVALY